MDYQIMVLSPETAAPFEHLLSAASWARYKRDPDSLIAFGAVWEGRASGILLAQVEAGVLVIRFLYVEPMSRGLGIGTELLLELLDAAAGVGEITAVSCDFIAEGDDALSLRKLLGAYGFRFEQLEPLEYAITLEQLGKIDWSAGALEGCLSFADLPDAYLKELSVYLAQNAECPLDLPLSRESLAQELSFAYIKDNKIGAAVFVQRAQEDRISLSWVFARPDLASAVKTLMTLFQKAFREAADRYSADTIVDICAINGFSARLIERLCPDSKGSPVLHAALDLGRLRQPLPAYAPISIESIIDAHNDINI